MRALVKYATGPGAMHLREVPEPTLRPGHIIVEVKACAICGTDLHIQAGEYPVDPPVIMGHEFSGIVAEVAPDVTDSHVGQRVACLVYFASCGVCEFCCTGQWNLCASRKSVGSGANGAFARYVLVPKQNARQLPENIDFLAGALTEPLACCTHGALEKADIKAGDVVVVLGPGSIGLLTAQIAVASGAIVVMAGTTADRERLELSKRLGTHHALDVETQSVNDLIDALTAQRGADLVFECSGAGAAARLGFQLARRRGQFVQIGLFGERVETEWDLAVFKEIECRTAFASTWTSWDYALKMLKQGRVQTAPLITDVLPLSQWEHAFFRFANRQGIKFILTPEE